MKNSSFGIAVNIDVPADDAWGVIGAVKGVDQWLQPITACRVEGNKRFCSTESGEFSEDILKIDHENRIFKYGIPENNMLPILNVIGEMRVEQAAENQSTVHWNWNFEVAEEQEGTVKEQLKMVGNMGIQGIQSLILQN